MFGGMDHVVGVGDGHQTGPDRNDGERTLRMVAEHADAWDCMFVPPDEWPEYRSILEMHCHEVGRDPSEITTMAHVRWPGDAEIAPLIDSAAAYHEAGVDVVVFTAFPPFDLRALERLAGALT